MEAVRAMLECMARRRGRQQGYTELIYDDKMAELYSDNEPYQQHDAMSYYNGADNAGPDPITDYEYDEKAGYHRDARSVEEVACEVAALLRRAECNDDALQTDISDVVGDRRWNRKMVEACLDDVIQYVEQGRFGMGDAMCAALDRATDVADDEFAFPRRHPQSLDGFIAIVSVGVLAELQGAWVLELLGFGEVRGKEEPADGTGEVAMLTSDKIVYSAVPRSNSFAAWWMREYDAYIPSDSVYNFLNRMEMVEFAL